MSRPTTIDLFCGAGGITEGFRQAGYDCLYANDVNESAIQTFRAAHKSARAEARPIELVDAKCLRTELGLRRGELDVLVGGPPCQGFSINAPGRFLDDPRNALFKHYLRFVDEFEPKKLLFENVPGMLSLAGGKIFERVIDELERRGYSVSYKILLAAHYGVPQKRWRMIVLGTTTGVPEHPEPTHYYDMRANFTGGASLTFKLLPFDERLLVPAVTLRDAIYDLPRLSVGEGEEVSDYTKLARSKYALEMRKGAKCLYNHVANRLSRMNLERLKHIKPGGAWTDIPFDLLPAGMKRARRSDHTKRYGRLRWEDLAGTVMTKCDPHWGAVYLPDQDRALTPREAARIQSFPDRYRFFGSRVSQYEQIGNAVPVKMAAAIARSLKCMGRLREEPVAYVCR